MPSEIMDEFIEDARDHLQAASQHLLALEKNPGDLDELNGLLRRLHTIKGNAGFLDLHHIYDLLHKAENTLQTAREIECRSCPPKLIEIQLQILDTTEVMLNSLADDKTDYVDWLDQLKSDLDLMDRALEGPAETGGQAVEIEPPPSRPPVTEPPEQPIEAEPPAHPASHIETAPLATSPKELAKNRLHPFMNRPGETSGADIEGLSTELEKIQQDLESWGGPHTRRALNLARTYLREMKAVEHSEEPPIKELLNDLIQNLYAWIDHERPGELSATVIDVEPDDLADQGRLIRQKVQDLIERGVSRFTFDLRNFQILRSSEIGALISAMKMATTENQTGLILDPGSQKGLIKVLTVMGLDKVYPFFENEKQAASAPG